MSAVTDTYSYDAHDKLTGISGGTNKTYGYDSNGNCTSVTVGTAVTSVTYDVENRVTQITYPSSATNTFAYNGEDLRMQKVDSSGTRNYVCDGSSPASAVLKDGSAVYTPGLSERRGSASKFTHADALGSTRGVTDSSQAVTDAMLYDAFGNTISRTGTTPTPFGFVGKAQYQTDSDSGLQLLGHRYYDPSIGRFLSSDPAKAGTNWYAYCDNNPLHKTDKTGLLPDWKDWISMFAVGIVIVNFPDETAVIIGTIIVVGIFDAKNIGNTIDSFVKMALPSLNKYINNIDHEYNNINPVEPTPAPGGGDNRKPPEPTPPPPPPVSPPPPPSPPSYGMSLGV